MTKKNDGLLTRDDVCRTLNSGDRVYITQNGVGRLAVVKQIYAWMDMVYLDLQSGENLNLEDYGKTWTASVAEDKKFLTQEEVYQALGIKPEDLEDLSDVELEEEIDWGPPQGKEEW